MRDLSDPLTAQDVADLRDLLGHPGWRLVEVMVDREWGAVGYAQKVSRTIGTLAPENAVTAAQHLMQANAALEAVHRVMRWPREQVDRATHLALGRVASMNRGGL